ncbi:efflux RND transporter periplasmic adaptor subunit [Heliobacterium chlorum]|uniref:Efflux RND transporter periplasmic adaptor subunit n=1 Tax=Heliobacterium chlorum TaxID=2698 RepID=A0ABR7T367_HELCL|nr:efflux RND transporter periplasmic adaptor subunit [Heliobacterium chlorum]MBC9784106.1 efflux RND transporter periplasmic adaptor subunit [Heliobacterium chlorum]
MEGSTKTKVQYIAQKIKAKKWIAFAVVASLVVVGGYAAWKHQKSNTQTEVQYDQAKVKRGDIVVGLQSDGTIKFSEVTLQFNVKGRVNSVLVNEGDMVEAGAVIARLDDKDYRDQYDLAVAKLNDTQEQSRTSKNSQYTSLMDSELKLKQMETNLQKLRDDYAMMQQLPDAYSANDIKSKKADLESSEIEYRNQQKKYELAKSEYERSDSFAQSEMSVKMAKENLENTVLYAPVSGKVLKLVKKAGENVAEDQDFAVLHENNEIDATTKVIEYDIGKVKIGQKVNIAVDAVPDKKYVGEVTKIDHLPATDSSGLVSYPVTVRITNADDDLRDGMTASFTFVIKEVDQCLNIPYSAVKIVDGKQAVTVLNDQGVMVERPIKTGFSDGTTVEVLEGLNGNETVVIPKRQKAAATDAKNSNQSTTKNTTQGNNRSGAGNNAGNNAGGFR